MFRPLILIVILSLAVQWGYLPALASDQSNELMALVQPHSVVTTAIEQETRQVEADNHIIPGVAIYAHNFGADEADRLAQEGVVIGPNSVGNLIELVSGNILLSPNRDTVIATAKAKIPIVAGATVFVCACSNDLVVYDLLQAKDKQVSVLINKQKINMEPGRLLVVSDQKVDDFEKLDVNCHCVAYRNAVPIAVKNKTAFMAEISISSALTAIQPLQRLTVSTQKQDKLVLEKLVKGAVLLGDFAHEIPTQQAASSNKIEQIADND